MKRWLVPLIPAVIGVACVLAWWVWYVVPHAIHLERHTIDVTSWERENLKKLVDEHEKNLIDTTPAPVSDAQAAELNRWQILSTKLDTK